MLDRHIYSVTEINARIKQLLDTNFTGLWLEGEISNFTHHSSGHMYFSLKDENSEIRAVMWRGLNQSLRFRPEDGMKVVVQGDVTVYPPRGQYQIIVNQLHPAGVGELQVAFEQLKERLRQEGLFEESRKRPLPPYPVGIGVVTSATGAAFRDIVNVLSRRAPYVRIILAPARVQGDGAAGEIVRGIEMLNSLGEIDVIIIGRGGGSLEDLWPFNEEIVARAVVASRLPVVSAVGHEVDYSISDFCADYRAPTPSAAAEIVARDTTELTAELRGIRSYLETRLTEKLDRLRSRLERLRNHYVFRLPGQRLQTIAQRVDELTSVLQTRMGQILRQRKQSLGHSQQQLHLLHPEQVLRRGYSITRSQDGEVIKNAADLRPEETVNTQFYRGSIRSQVTEIEENHD